ncbi:MAG: ABC transporter substrate-binding protein [Candidatus Melainabacteria bacterium]|nr:ABC transporter substrate-binding protein [Candidatus Melainabacteria bacterium]
MFGPVLKKLIVPLFAGVLLASSVLAQTGKTAVADLVTLLSAWSGDNLDSIISNAAAKHIDFAGMAECALGKVQWDRLGPARKREFVATFRRLVEHRYYRRWHKIFHKGTLAYVSEANASDDTIVKTLLRVGKKEDVVIWRLRSSDGDLKVISLSVEGKDLLKRLNARFQRHLQKDGFDGLMAWLKDKLDEDDDLETSSAAIILVQ